MGQGRVLGWSSPGLHEGITPAQLAALHPGWALDMHPLSAWRFDPKDKGQEWGCETKGQGSHYICGPCTSTMDVAFSHCQAGGLTPWDSVVAPLQSLGRGQLRRPWLSAAGNLFVTLVCPPAPSHWEEVRSLVLGYLLAEALETRFGDVRVKWPNDLLMNDHKVGGILVEERGGCILAGIGLNLAWAPGAEELRAGHSVTAGMIPASSVGLGPLGLWLFLVNRLETGYRTLLESHTLAEFLTLFRSRLAWTGRRVFVQEGPRTRYQATILGVSGKGELVVSRDGEEIPLVSGDVTPL